MVHHMYAKSKNAPPGCTMNQFIADNQDKLSAGWADRLNAVGDSNLSV
jgi:hypothetical protein